MLTQLMENSHVQFSKQILTDIKKGVITNNKELGERRFFWSKEFKLDHMPSNPFILSNAKNPSKKVLSILAIKPTRSLSGVQIIAVMLPPFPCLGGCIYCPAAFEGKIAPQSYTGYEPSTLRAQRNNYDSYKIVEGRINQLDATGNFAEKIELIFQGSSFTAWEKHLQEKFVKDSFDAVIGKKTKSFEQSKLLAEKSKRRIVGVTFETRPNLCKKEDIDRMLELAGTRVEIGVQNPDDKIYEITKRGHTVSEVITSTQMLKDSCFKVLYHLMPGQPGSDLKKDLKNFKKVFTDKNFKPDMVKFYPTLLMEGTHLHAEWEKGNFTPITEKEAVKLMCKLKPQIPKWVRIMRVNRDIPSTVITDGVKRTNLRQVIHEEMKKKGLTCSCIRCREVGLKSRNEKIDFSNAKIGTEFYEASSGQEAFISYENKDALFGFARLRNPLKPFRKEITDRTALIRELHVYGKVLGVGKKGESTQHKGIGKLLMDEAEKIAIEKFDANKIVIISGLGVKEYYIKNFGYSKEGPYVSKKL